MTTSRPRPVSRLVTLDVIRGLAIICMLIAHGMPFFWATGLPTPVAYLTRAINDVASPLFGLAMGAAAALVWARAEVRDGWPRRVLTDVGRGVVVFAIGLLLVKVDTWIAIVLHVLGVLMIIGIPVAALAGAAIRAEARAWWWALLGLTVALFALAPWVTGALAPAADRVNNGRAEGWAEIGVALLSGQSYRALSLLPFFALGALLATTGWLARPRAIAAAAAGPAAAGAVVLAGGFLVSDLSGDLADQGRDLGLVAIAVLVAGVLVVVSEAYPIGIRVVADLGAIALSVYALQVVVLKPLQEWPAWRDSAGWAWAAMTVLVLAPVAAGLLWRRLVGPGPAEMLVALVTGKGRAT